MTTFSAIILAAGKGTRMKSDLPKPLHQLAHKPMLGYVVDTYMAAGAAEIILVIGPDDTITPALYPQHTCVIQHDRLGTGHAAQIGVAALTQQVDRLVIALGDQPFVSLDTVQKTIAAPDPVTVVAMQPANPGHYGRLITCADHSLERIVEYKDANNAQRAITLCNAYPIALHAEHAAGLLHAIKNNNAAGEYYFTDAITIANDMGLRCGYLVVPEAEAAGVNSRAELAVLEKIVQDRLRHHHMMNGATLQDPETVYFAHDTVIGRDVIIEPNVFFGPGVVVGDKCHIKAFSHIENTVVGIKAELGPFVRLRSGNVVGDAVKVGNFVEAKKTSFGAGTKVNHLAYVGDATIGKKCNISAGVIISNYDGIIKYPTIIGDDTLIGCNNTLVAPVTIGSHAYTAAGSVITKDVPDNTLAIARSQQTNKAGWVEKFRARKLQEKEGK